MYMLNIFIRLNNMLCFPDCKPVLPNPNRRRSENQTQGGDAPRWWSTCQPALTLLRQFTCLSRGEPCS